MFDIIKHVCICQSVILFLLFILALMKAAAPRNRYERMKDDYEQMKALGYFKDTVTSGCPVKDSPVD